MWWRLKSPASRLFTQTFIQAQIKENIKVPRHWPLCGELTRMNSPHKWPVTRKMFPFDDVIVHLLASCVSVRSLPFPVAMPAVRYNLSGGLPTWLWFIMYQAYNFICIFTKLVQTWYDNHRIYLFLLNKLCLGLSTLDHPPQAFTKASSWNEMFALSRLFPVPNLH